MTFLEVLLSTCFFGILLLGVANTMSSLKNELILCEGMSRGIFLAREKMEVFLQRSEEVSGSGMETVEGGDGYRFRCAWELQDNFPTAGMGLLTLEVCPVGGERGKILCRSFLLQP